MFPEYRDQIAQLRANDRHFVRLFDKHNALDHQVRSLEDKRSPALQVEIENLKKEKLAIKGELYAILKKTEAA